MIELNFDPPRCLSLVRCAFKMENPRENSVEWDRFMVAPRRTQESLG